MNNSIKLFSRFIGLTAIILLLSLHIFAQNTYTTLQLNQLVQGTVRQGETVVYRFDAPNTVNPASLTVGVQGNQARLGFRVINLRTSSIVAASEPPVISSVFCFAPNSGTYELQVWHAEGTASQPYNITYASSNDNNCNLSTNNTTLSPGSATSINVSSMSSMGAALPFLRVKSDPTEETVVIVHVPRTPRDNNNGNDDGNNNGNDDGNNNGNDDGNNNGNDDGNNNGNDDGNNNGNNNGNDDGNNDDDNDGEVIITDPDTNEIIDRRLLDGTLIIRLPGGREIDLQVLLNGALPDLGNVTVLVETLSDVTGLLGDDINLLGLDSVVDGALDAVLNEHLLGLDSLGQILHLNLDGTVDFDAVVRSLTGDETAGSFIDTELTTGVLDTVNTISLTDNLGGTAGNLTSGLVSGGNGNLGMVDVGVNNDANANGGSVSLDGDASGGLVAGAINGDSTSNGASISLDGNASGGLVAGALGGDADGGLVGAGLGGDGSGGLVGVGIGGDGSGGLVGVTLGNENGEVGVNLGGENGIDITIIGEDGLLGGDGLGGLIGGDGLLGGGLIGGGNGSGNGSGGGSVPCIPIPFIKTCP